MTCKPEIISYKEFGEVTKRCVLSCSDHGNLASYREDPIGSPDRLVCQMCVDWAAHVLAQAATTKTESRWQRMKDSPEELPTHLL